MHSLTEAQEEATCEMFDVELRYCEFAFSHDHTLMGDDLERRRTDADGMFCLEFQAMLPTSVPHPSSDKVS